MNYKKIHDQIIERARNRILPTDSYKERHHIIPRCMGGTDDIDNLVYLTAREHYIVHQLLVKIYPENYNLVYSAILMSTHSSTGRVNNRLYEWLKKRNAEITSKRNKENLKCPKYKKKLLRNLDAGRKTVWDDPVKAEQMRKAISKRSKKKWECSDYREKISKANKEYWSDPENRKKAGERARGKNNPGYGTHWYHHPETLDNIKCKPDEVPEGYVKGRKLRPDKPKPNTKCVTCGVDTGKKNAKYCNEHRPLPSSNFVLESSKEFLEPYNSRYQAGESLRSLAKELPYSHVMLFNYLKRHFNKKD